MSGTIICMSEEEPSGFHSGTSRGFSVRLAFESKLGNEQDDCAAMEAFIHALHGAGGTTLQFKAFSVGDDQFMRPIDDPVLLSGPLEAPDAFIAWLKDCEKVAKKEGVASFWGARATQPNVFESSATLDATRLLIGASSWLAPVPHQLGLAHVLRIGADVSGDIVFLPYFTTNQLPVPVERQVDGEEVAFVYLPTSGLPDDCRSTRTRAAKQEGTLVDLESGFVEVREQDQDQELHRTVSRLEQRAGSLFNGLFAVSEVEWPAPATHLQAVRRCSWRAVSTLGACLDTLLLALMMPNQVFSVGTPAEKMAANSRDGAVLGPFLDLLIEQFEQRGLQLAFSRARLRAAVRKGIGSTLEKTTEEPQRRRNIEKLLRICQPNATPDVSPIASGGSWLHWLLQGYILQTSDGWVAAARNAPDQDLEKSLAVELARLHEAMLSENGIEATLLRLLHEATAKVVEELQPIYGLPVEKATLAYTQALEALGNLLSCGLNGADAARQSVGSLLCDTIIRLTQPKTSSLTAPNLKTAALSMEFWSYRLGLGIPAAGSASEILLSVLASPITHAEQFFAELKAKPPQEGLPQDAPAIAALDHASKEMQTAVLGELFAADTQRFAPDLAPAPLAIPLTIDAVIDDEDSPDDFSAAFSGMALLLRRSFKGENIDNNPWAYANLAQIDSAVQGKAPLATDAIQPLPTTINDGRRSLFLQYDGLPFSSSAFDASLPGDNHDPTRSAFFTTDYPEQPQEGGLKPLPPLAYGALYEVSAHVVGRTGSLPEVLQRTAGRPWEAAPGVGNIAPEHILQRPYSRRTAIGRTTLSDGTATARIGVVPAGLRPLAAEFPRLGLHSDASLVLDLFRRTDGSGALEYNSKKPFDPIYLEDLRHSGSGESELTVELWDGVSCQTVALVLGGDKAVMNRLCIQLGDGHADEDSTPIEFAKPAADTPLWLRLKLKAEKNTTTTVSFADPAVGAGRAPGQVLKADNLLLLGAPYGSNRPLWRPPYDDETTVVSINFPRVGYADFQRWVANPEQRKEMFKDLQDDALMREFLLQLEAANIDRSRDLQLGRLLDSLVDPAVDSLRLDLVMLDGLSWPVSELAQRKELQPVPAVSITVRSVGSMLASIDNLSLLLTQRRIKELLTRLDNLCRYRLNIEALAAGAKDGLGFDTARERLSIPAGVSVQFRARPRVKAALFANSPSVLYGRLQELAVGTEVGRVVFDGPTLLIESMPGPLLNNDLKSAAPDWLLDRQGWTAIGHEVIHYEAVGNARSYKLQAAGHADWHWRQLGSVTVTTQRWRFLGRPIYSWINPNEGGKQDSACASREIANTSALLSEFEEEAFQGREDIDASSITVNLLPTPASTTLHQVDWEKPSATLFRHRFTLHARYAAAMRQSADSQCEAWSDEPLQAWRRVVMLAEPSRIALTRPQLRALIPLTQSPDEGAGHTPPLLAILQERPFEYGGLADRMVAEIRSGIGFGFTQLPVPQESRVAPYDVRQELGPDPRLSYSAYGDKPRQSTLLSVEGPIGLTFESGSVSAPVFVNNAQILTPVHLSEGEHGRNVTPSPGLEEHFLSVGLRHYLHPDWVVTPCAVPQPQALDFSRPFWIELAQLEGSLQLARGGASLAVVSCVPKDDVLRIMIDPRVMDLTVSSGDALEIACIPLPANTWKQWKVVLLNTPVDDRSASLSVFMVPPKNAPERRGSGNAPMLLASLDWSLPPTYQTNDLAAAGLDVAVREISASQTTAMHWARTNRNFAAINIAGAELYQPEPAILVNDLLALLDKRSLHFARRKNSGAVVWPRSAQSMQAYPTHTQRHLALLFSETHAELGRKQEKPTGLHMLPARSVQLDAAILPAPAMARVRVIEFETTAIILGYAAGAQLPPQHKFGYLDFAAVGFDLLPAVGKRLKISLNLRLIAGTAARGELSSVTLTMRPEPSSSNGACELLLTRNSTAELATFWLELSIDELGKIDATKAWEVDSLGQSQSMLINYTKDELGGPATQGLVLEIKAATFNDGVPRELWLETSMLLSTAAKDSTQRQGFAGVLDLDWFFGADPLSPDTACKEDALRQLHEAQARIISVSPPISIRSV